MEKVFARKTIIHLCIKRIRFYLSFANDEECSFSDKIRYCDFADSLADSLFVLNILSLDKYRLLRRIISENIRF